MSKAEYARGYQAGVKKGRQDAQEETAKHKRLDRATQLAGVIVGQMMAGPWEHVDSKTGDRAQLTASECGATATRIAADMVKDLERRLTI